MLAMNNRALDDSPCLIVARGSDIRVRLSASSRDRIDSRDNKRG